MFRKKQPSPPTSFSLETDSIDSLELNIRLSGSTIVRLLSITIAVIFGSGVLVHKTSTETPLADPPAKTVELPS